jgi:hypothetical protein
MRRYQSFKCKERRDTIYALFNLMGQTKMQLRVDYNSTILEVFVKASCFMRTFEALPTYDIIGVGTLLGQSLGFFKTRSHQSYQA